MIEVVTEDNSNSALSEDQMQDAEGFMDALNMLHVIYNFVPASREDAVKGGGPLAFLWDIFHNNLVTDLVKKYTNTKERDCIREEVIKMSELEVITKQFIDDYANAEEKGEAKIVRNMYNKGKSVNEIEDLTGVPLEKVKKILRLQ